MEEMIKCLEIIVRPKDATAGGLVKALQRLDEISRDPTVELHPRLKHFLMNRSYEKALIWLDDGEPEKGVCGG